MSHRFALILLSAVALAQPSGCQSAEGGGRVVAPQQVFSGEELYEGLIFGEGPVAEILPELAEWDASALSEEERAALEVALQDADLDVEGLAEVERALAEDEQAAALRAATVEAIEVANPTFFERFAASIHSGDHFEVGAALDEALDVTQQAARPAADAVDGFVSPTNSQGWILPGPLALVLYRVLYPGIWTIYIGGGTAVGSSGSLTRERAIGLIVDRLALG